MDQLSDYDNIDPFIGQCMQEIWIFLQHIANNYNGRILLHNMFVAFRTQISKCRNFPVTFLSSLFFVWAVLVVVFRLLVVMWTSSSLFNLPDLCYELPSPKGATNPSTSDCCIKFEDSELLDNHFELLPDNPIALSHDHGNELDFEIPLMTCDPT